MKIFLSSFLLLLSYAAFPQTYKQTIKSTVTDKDSREPLPSRYNRLRIRKRTGATGDRYEINSYSEFQD